MRSSDDDAPPSVEDGVDLVDLVADALEALEEGGAPALDSLLEQHAAQAATVRRRLSLLLESGLDPVPRGTSAPQVPEVLGDFRLVRQLGHGGMGVVWLAEERSLGRQVALKLVRPDQLLFPGARERFRREVEVIARLQHPGIVPVYSVGEENGLPYFAMEYVVGATLSEALKAMQLDDPRDASGAALGRALPSDGEDAPVSALYGGPWPDVCARIAREVADALEHARRRGVVHRDVKPSNVMVTRGGRVQLFDFGLSSREGDARLTRTGAVLGSLAYMPPEAFAADADAEDTRQDVYGLGVTLYELLANALPFPITNTVALQRAIVEADVRPLRNANPGVPPDLAAVVGKAMEPDPRRRYQTPAELADDLGRFLARRPVRAVPPSLVLRLRRWVQRSPARAAALTVLVLAPTALFVQQLLNSRVVGAKNEAIEEANTSLRTTNANLEQALSELGRSNADLLRSKADVERALEEARRQRGVAETSFVKALDALDTMLTEVAEERLAGVPGIEDVRRDLLSEALRLYEWFLAQDLSSPELKSEVARVARKAADLSGFLSELGAAEAALGRSEELLAELVDANPRDIESAIELADTKQRQSERARLQGDLDGAERLVEEGLEAIDALYFEKLNPIGRVQWLRARSGLLTSRAMAAEERGEVAGAQARFAEAIALLRRGLDEDPGNYALEYDLSRALDLSGALRSRYAFDGVNPATDVAALETAEEELLEARGLAEGLVARDPEHTLARFRLTRVLVNLAFVHNGLGRGEEARAGLAASLAQQERLVAENPEVAQYAIDLSTGLYNQAVSLGDDPATARPMMARALELIEPLAEQQPTSFQLQSQYGATLGFLAIFDATAGDLDGAARRGRAGHAALRRALALSPHQPLLKAHTAQILTRLREVFGAAGRGDCLLELEAGLLGLPPDDPDLDGYARVVLAHLGADDGGERSALVDTAGRAFADALHARGLDLFALLDVPAGAELLDTPGFAEALERALAGAPPRDTGR